MIGMLGRAWQPPTARAEIMPPTLARPQDQSRFQVTAFATGLAYPTSMTQLADGSLLVATNAGGASWLPHYIFASPSASLVRLTDVDRDGVADGPGQTLATGLPGLVSSVRRVGDLIFALSSGTGQKGISVLRTGSAADSSLSPLGQIALTFPGSFGHTTYGLAARPAAGGGVELYFNIGAQGNNASTPPSTTVGLSTTGALTLQSGTAALLADSIYRVVVTESGTSVAVSAPVQIATGLRNAAGMTFYPAGDLYIAGQRNRWHRAYLAVGR
jgi:glucose/arabinose dehydrogenase